MQTFKYKPFYEYKGPSSSNPFREEKTPEEAAQSLEYFFSELANHFGDFSHKTQRSGDTISITVDMSEKDCDSLVASCLNDNDLYADKIKD